MDTTDPSITFDSEGSCSNCRSALELSKRIWFPDATGSKMLNLIFENIRKEGAGKEYDCIIGLSGGVDSSYLAYLSVKNGLRPLILHVDCGWNSSQAVRNIENIVRKLNLELHTFVVNWEEMKDLQRAFFLASLPDQDIPQDHAIFGALYRFAAENNVRYVLNGYNFATESIMPSAWGHQAMDHRHLKAIHHKFGERALKEYPALTFFNRYIYYKIVKGMNIIYPLNFIEYRKDTIIDIMKMELGWEQYGQKHHESRFTRFFQSYYLPVKFNIDKRKAHLSSMIISGQITREDALKIISAPPYNEEDAAVETDYVAKKLDWSTEEFKSVMQLPPKKHSDFATSESLFRLGSRVKSFFKA